MTDLLAPGMEKAIKFIQNLEEKDLKEKVNIGAWGRGGGDRSPGPWDGESYQVYTEPGGKRSQGKGKYWGVGGGGGTDLLAPGMEKAIKFIQNLEEKDLKEKVNIGAWGGGTDLLAPGMEKAIKFIQNLEEKDLKEKVNIGGGVTDLLAPGMEKAIKFIQNLEEKDLKEKVNIGGG